jgi:hypothetical protein
MIESRAQSADDRERSAGDVESPKVAAEAVDLAGAASEGRPQWGGRRGRGVGCATAGRGPESESVDGARLREWARAWAEKFPPWSDVRWRQVNAALGYRLVDGSEGAAREKPD